MTIKCYLLSPRGFCSGVHRTVNMAEQVLKLYSTVYITEDIIHNKMFMNDIIKKGIIKVSSLDDIPDRATVMFSAHGVPPQIIAKADKKELTVIDGTCPLVKAIQDEIKLQAELGKKIVIIGDRSHAEIIAFIGYIDSGNVFVIYDETDIEMLPDFSDDEVIYFTQTTLDHSHVDAVVNVLKEKIPHMESNSQDNICYATKERQEVVKHIADSVDLIIIVGSSHSSNAKRLYEVALSTGVKNAVLIDSKNDLDETILNNIKTMAVTSSASTSEKVVQDLIEHLKSTFDIIVEDFELPKKDG